MRKTANAVAALIEDVLRNEVQPIATATNTAQVTAVQAGTAAAAAQSTADAAEPALGNPAADNYILSSNTAGVRLWVPRVSTATPQPLGTAAAGATGVASDAGHVHAMPTAAQVGAVPTTGGTFSGDVRLGLSDGGSRAVIIDGASGFSKSFIMQTGSVSRWAFQSSNEDETGSNAGSNFRLSSIDDAATAVAIRMVISRATGLVTFNNGVNVASGQIYSVNNTQVVAARRTGWTAATGTATRTTFATSTVTTAQLAERVKALLDDLISHGLIGS
jgi:hypothetical protein